MNKKLVVLIFFAILAIFITSIFFKNKNEINWANKVSQSTINDSWGTWKNNFQDLNPEISRELFMQKVKEGKYKTITIPEFLNLNVENQRLEKYINAKTAEEAYPISDRPRAEDDIQSVNYFLYTKGSVSPIVVAKIKKDKRTRYIKLDGVHRLIAAAIKKSKVKILFLDF